METVDKIIFRNTSGYTKMYQGEELKYSTSLEGFTKVTYLDGSIKYYDIEGEVTGSRLSATTQIDNVASAVTIELGNKVTSIGYCTFYKCTNLASISIPDSVTNISGYSFYSATTLQEVIIPDSVTSIGTQAFYYCSGLSSVTLSNSITELNQTFGGCTSLTSIVLPSTLTKCTNNVFGGCTALTSITCYATTAPSVEWNTFSQVHTGGTLNYPEGSDYSSWLSTEEAYLGYYHWNESIPVSTAYTVSDITQSATEVSASTTSITVNWSGNTIITYKDGSTKTTSEDCSSAVTFEENTVASDVTRSGTLTWNGCTVDWNVVQKARRTTIVTYYDEDSGTYYDYPFNIEGTLSSSNVSKRYLVAIDIGAGVTSISAQTFADAYFLESVKMSDTVTSIGNSAFSGCAELKSVVLSTGLTTLSAYLFTGCESLDSVVIPDNVTIINLGAFSGCTSLTSIEIPDSVTKVGGSAFTQCTSISSVTLSNSLVSISGGTFSGCTSLTSITIPSSVTALTYGSFAYCTSLTSITCNRTTAPTLKSNSFQGIAKNGTLYYPSGSDYSTWLKTSGYYLGYYKWTGQAV